ncbi:MAG: FtsH protease activity modulator HflK [Legionellales bacterium]|nr:FtsH protease activity modulator HflK [Legionellales bacterium]
MAWDDNNNNDKDPWDRRKSDSPPDLDEVVKKLQAKFSKYFGGGSDNYKKGSGKGGMAIASFSILGIVFLVLWILSGIFIVGPAEEAVITRFGKYRSTVGPGLNWIPRFVDKYYIVDIQNVYDYSYNSSMLTQDENIASVEFAVQYRIDNPKDYLFNVVNPQESLQQALASALRHVIGHTDLGSILSTGRGEVRERVRQQLKKILSRYNTGLVLLDVIMQPATPPEKVKDAFDDAIKAQEDEQRYKHQAEAYERGVVPVAKGKAKRILEAANAYKSRRILSAQGEIARFNALLPEFKKYPKVTKERLYLDAMEKVLTDTKKIILDAKNSNNLMYLPLDKIFKTDTVDSQKNSVEFINNPEENIQGDNNKVSGSYNSDTRDNERYRSRRRSY